MLTSLFGDLRALRDRDGTEPSLHDGSERGFAAKALLESVATGVNDHGQMVDSHIRDLVVDGSPAQAIRNHFAATRADLQSARSHITLYDPTGAWATSVIKALSDAGGRPIERLHLRQQGTLRTLAMIERTTVARRQEEPLRIYHADVRAPGTDNAAIPMALMERSHMTAVIVGAMHPQAIDEMLQSLLVAVQQPNWRCPSLLFMLPPSAVWIANKIGVITWPQQLRVQVLNESLATASAVWNSLLGIWNRVKSEPVWAAPPAPDLKLAFQIKVADLALANKALAAQAAIPAGEVIAAPLDFSLTARALDIMSSLDGMLGCAVVDASTGLILAQQTIDELNPVLALAAAASTQVLRAHQQSSRDMGLTNEVDEVMTSAGPRHHVMRTVSSHPGLFLFALLDKQRTNLALARYKLLEAEQSLA